MALNTPHNVTLTEGQIGIILCSLEKYFKGVKDTKEVDTIFNILEGSLTLEWIFFIYPFDFLCSIENIKTNFT